LFFYSYHNHSFFLKVQLLSSIIIALGGQTRPNSFGRHPLLDSKRSEEIC
ncbi:unnamed protein product, partial [Cylicostephanus goldi]